jgi:hypothetical protein
LKPFVEWFDVHGTNVAMASPAELAHQVASNKTPGATNQNFS